jgi:hypothetical protein
VSVARAGASAVAEKKPASDEDRGNTEQPCDSVLHESLLGDASVGATPFDPRDCKLHAARAGLLKIAKYTAI